MLLILAILESVPWLWSQPFPNRRVFFCDDSFFLFLGVFALLDEIKNIFVNSFY